MLFRSTGTTLSLSLILSMTQTNLLKCLKDRSLKTNVLLSSGCVILCEQVAKLYSLSFSNPQTAMIAYLVCIDL